MAKKRQKLSLHKIEIDDNTLEPTIVEVSAEHEDMAESASGAAAAQSPGDTGEQKQPSLEEVHNEGKQIVMNKLFGINEKILPLEHAGETNVQEERRLFYVGITRAKEELILTTSGAPSRFWRNCPKEPRGKKRRLSPCIGRCLFFEYTCVRFCEARGNENIAPRVFVQIKIS